MTDIQPAFPGLVWAYHFSADGRTVAPLDGEASSPSNWPPDGFVWLHLALPDGRIEGQLARLAELTPAVAAALVSRDRHLFLTIIDGALTGVMPGFQNDLTSEIRDVGLSTVGTQGPPVRSISPRERPVHRCPVNPRIRAPSVAPYPSLQHCQRWGSDPPSAPIRPQSSSGSYAGNTV